MKENELFGEVVSLRINTFKMQLWGALGLFDNVKHNRTISAPRAAGSMQPGALDAQ